RWGIDANKGDRTFIALLSRLTRINAQSIETIVDVDEDEIYSHPFVVAIAVGFWPHDRRHQFQSGYGRRLGVREYSRRLSQEIFVNRHSPGAQLCCVCDDALSGDCWSETVEKLEPPARIELATC